MSELKVYRDPKDGPAYREFYEKSEADKVIADKDAEILDLIEQVQKERSAKVDYKISANDLSDGLKKAYEKIRTLRRALLLVCAKRADAEAHIENNLADLLLKGQTLRAVDYHRLERDKWYKRAVGCRAKAEECK